MKPCLLYTSCSNWTDRTLFNRKTRTGLLSADYHMGGGTLTGENHLMDSTKKDGERKRRIAGKDSDRATERVA